MSSSHQAAGLHTPTFLSQLGSALAAAAAAAAAMVSGRLAEKDFFLLPPRHPMWTKLIENSRIRGRRIDGKGRNEFVALHLQRWYVQAPLGGRLQRRRGVDIG